jgi:tRNA(Arg) A34 adenosine deaminase TadA
MPKNSNAIPNHNSFMAMAIAAMHRTALEERTGEPYGAVIVKNNELIAVAGNSVKRDNDPTAHAEINAIRAAGKILNSWDLNECILYTSCQCCSMCYAAAAWAGIKKIYYAAGWDDYNDIYDDQAIVTDLQKPNQLKNLAPEQIMRSEAVAVWQAVRRDRGLKTYPTRSPNA